jgi:hypothetical protein
MPTQEKAVIIIKSKPAKTEKITNHRQKRDIVLYREITWKFFGLFWYVLSTETYIIHQWTFFIASRQIKSDQETKIQKSGRSSESFGGRSVQLS